MRRLFLAALMALALHAVLFNVSVQWGREKPLSTPPPLCLSLSYRNPEIQSSPPSAVVQEPPRLPDPPPAHNVEEPKREHTPQKKPASTKLKKSPKVPTKRRVRETKQVPVKTEAPPSTERSPKNPVAGPEMPEKRPSNQASAMKIPGNPVPSSPPPEEPEEDRGLTHLREAVPVYRKNPTPEYPSLARRRGYEGTVVMEVFVDREGRVQDLRLYQSSGHEVLDRAAMKAVKGWLFEPARRGSVKMEMWVKVPLSFRLE